MLSEQRSQERERWNGREWVEGEGLKGPPGGKMWRNNILEQLGRMEKGWSCGDEDPRVIWVAWWSQMTDGMLRPLEGSVSMGRHACGLEQIDEDGKKHLIGGMR